MGALILLVLALFVIGATIVLATRGRMSRAAKVLFITLCGVPGAIAAMFALEWLADTGGRASVIVALMFLAFVGVRYTWPFLRSIRAGGSAHAVSLSAVAGALALLGMLFLLGGGYAALFGLLLLFLAAIAAGLSIVLSGSAESLGGLWLIALALILGFLVLSGVALWGAGDAVMGVILIGAAVVLAVAALPQVGRAVRGPRVPEWSWTEMLNPPPESRIRRRLAVVDTKQPRPSNFQRACRVIRGRGRPHRGAS